VCTSGKGFQEGKEPDGGMIHRRNGGTGWKRQYFSPAVLTRNFLFLIAGLLYGCRRLAPPY
jgi:hypothetical protein